MSELKKTGSEIQIATSADVSNAVSGVAHLAGTETFTGVKTFNNTIFVGDGSSSNMMLTSGDIRKMTNGTVKTYSFPASAGTLELQGHKHNELNAYYTTIAAVDNMDETGGQIRRENITMGMLFDNISITDPSNNNTQLLIKIGIPVTNENFTNDSLYTVSKINLEIYDVTKSEYIIEWQSIAIDHTKDNQGRNFFLEENGFTVNPNYTFVQFDWTQYLSSAPFMLTKEQNDTYTFYESWGPLSTSKSSLSPSTWTGNSNQQIATVDLIDSKLGEYAKNNHTHHSIITPVGSAELSTDVGNYGGFRSSLYVHSPSGSNSYPPAIFIGSANQSDYDSSYNIQIDTVTGGMSIYANHNYMTYRPITRYLIDRIERKTSANDNTYSLLFPALTADETIATVSNINGFVPYYDASLKSVALGDGSVATGSGSLALVSANAIGNGSIAMGTSAVSACGTYTIAMGAGITMTSGTMGTFAHGNSVSAIGRGCHAEGRATIAGSAVTTFAAHSEGWNTSAFAHYSHSEGVCVGIPSADKFAYAWNGVSAASASGGYSSHGEGTFNINPSGGLDGFYIGDTPLSTTLATYQTTAGMSDYQLVSAMTGYASATHTHSYISGYNIGLSANPNSQIPAFDIVGNESGELLNIGASNPINTDYLSLDANGIYIIDRATEDNWVYFSRNGIHIVPSWNNDEDYVLAFPQITANKTIATTDEANLIKLLNLYVDATTPTTAFEMDSSVGWYRGCIGSDGVLPTLDWSNFSMPTDSVYQCTLALRVNSSATTLTGPSDISWVAGAGLPTSSFAGHWIFISLIREGWENSFTQAAVWRVL